MNVLCSAAKNNFWLDVFEKLDKSRFKPVYWVGTDKVRGRGVKCFYHNVWEAFSLQGGVSGWEQEAKVLGDGWSTKTEYYNYLKILDRVDGDGSFSFMERDNLFKRQLSYWSFVIEKFGVDLIFFSNTPHLPHDYPLYLCAKKMGIKTLMFNVSSLHKWVYLTEDIGGRAIYSGFLEKNPEYIEDLFLEGYEKFLHSKHELPWYMKEQNKKDKNIFRSLETNRFTAIPFHFFDSLFRKIALGVLLGNQTHVKNKYRTIKFYSGLYKTKSPNFLDIASFKVKSSKKKKMLKAEYSKYSVKINPEKYTKYIYFPLHYQPELTTTPLGGEASDQFHVISEISRALPSDTVLVVKEHPSQYAKVLYGSQGRYLGCWESIYNLPNVIICDITVSSIALINHAEAVVTVTGTAGWEALVNKKTSFHFGGAWYQAFPAAKKLDFNDIKSQLKEGLEKGSGDSIKSKDLCKYFGDNAIKANIHGSQKEQRDVDMQLTVEYIKIASQYYNH